MILAWAVLVAAGLIAALTFVALYAWRSVEWYASAVGRNLMAMAAVLAGMFGLSLVALVVPVWPWLWLGGMGSLDAVLWWRVVILWRLQHEKDVSR